MTRANVRRFVFLVAMTCFAAPASAHPGSGIAVDRSGQVYFIDTGAGLWKIDLQGRLIHLGGPLFHWMALDLDDRFATARLPSGTAGEITRIGSNPTVLVSSDFPIAIGRDGNLYYPSRNSEGRVRIMRFTPSGETSTLATLAATSSAGEPFRDLNGLTAASDGSLYFTENSAVRRVTMQGDVSTIISGVHAASCAKIPGMTDRDNPLLRGLTVGPSGTMYVAASGCGSVLAIGRDRAVTSRLQVEGPWSPTAVALFDRDVYVLEYLHTEVETSSSRQEWLPRVRKVSANGGSTVVATVRRR